MSDAAADTTVIDLPPRIAPEGFTPTGLQRLDDLRRRRMLVLALNIGTIALVGAGVWRVFAAGGWAPGEMVMFACFLLGAPWTAMGLWNAAIGLWVIHGPRGVVDACPMAHDGDGDEPIRLRTAIVICLRNEEPSRPLARLLEARRSLDATGWGGRYEVFAMSDTSDPAIAAEEARQFEALRPLLGPGAAYRRREVNRGFKAGNVHDFLVRYGDDFDLFVPLDSDSVMGGREIVKLTRIMQKHPRLGLLQSMCVGAPSASLFTRIQQFGGRHCVRAYTTGMAWWNGDCCTFWGHNAIIRLKPFREHCALPIVPGRPPIGGYVLSHDQIEATLMRRAGYETRILPVEGDSFEEVPPDLIQFVKREQRWCNGNMQYFHLARTPGLRPTSRAHLLMAIGQYTGGPSWVAMMAAVAWMLAFPPAAVEGAPPPVSAAFGIAMFFLSISVALAPKIAGWVDVALTPGGARRYGGAGRFAIGAVVDLVHSILIAPVCALHIAIFIAGLPFGRKIAWSGQQREVEGVAWVDAARMFWPQTLAGVFLAGMVLAFAPASLPWAAPALAGFLLVVPYTVLTASPRLGRLARTVGLCAIPEDFAPTDSLRRVAEGLPSTARAA